MPLLITLLVLALLGILVLLYLQHPKFGSLPKGNRLEQIKRSPNYQQGKFQNLHHTPSLAEGSSTFQVLKKMLFHRSKRTKPKHPIPSQKTVLLDLPDKEDVLVWFGHSSYFLQLDGRKFLVDPVFSGSASPLPFGTQAFKGTDRYTTADIPEIDYLLISHDHWDHLDFNTIKALRPKVNQVICSLGTGAHLESWGYNPQLIMEKDWNETFDLENGFSISTVPARHFSGRSFKRNTSLWTSYILKTSHWNLFLGGDSGYDTHFLEIGEKFGPFDLAILENGQYNEDWKYIHLLPDQVLKAAKDLRAKKLFPVHNSKFALSLHAWDEPLRELTNLHSTDDPFLIHPLIGEKVKLTESQQFSRWWEGIE